MEILNEFQTKDTKCNVYALDVHFDGDENVNIAKTNDHGVH